MAATKPSVDLSPLYRKLGVEPPPPDVDIVRDEANVWAISLSTQHFQENRPLLNAWLGASPKHVNAFVRAVDWEIYESGRLPEEYRHLELTLPRSDRRLKRYIAELQASPERLAEFIDKTTRHFSVKQRDSDRRPAEAAAPQPATLGHELHKWLKAPVQKQPQPSLAAALGEEAPPRYASVDPESRDPTTAQTSSPLRESVRRRHTLTLGSSKKRQPEALPTADDKSDYHDP